MSNDYPTDFENKASEFMKRTDYPLCPYCGAEIAVFYPEDEPERITLYCAGDKKKLACKGRGLRNAMNGYDIKLSDITFKY